MKILTRVYEFFLNIIFPRKCPFCDNIIGKGYMCCVTCAPKLPFIGEDRCYLCGMDTESCHCGGRARGYKKVVAPFMYEQPVIRGVWKLKYRGYKDVCKTLAKYVAQAATEHLDLKNINYVVSVPMYKTKERRRGYNQSNLLARDVADELELTYLENVLVRDFEGREQHKLSVQGRKANVRGLYTAKDYEKISGETVILVDDVLTTGATLSECARILKIFGAKEVICLIIAVTDIAKD